jgi:RNA polymerase sigma-70 factor, ECF subfamily
LIDNIVAPVQIDPEECSIRDDLENAINGLPKSQKIAVTLLKIDGLSVKEAAAKTGTSESAIKTNAHRAYKNLRKKLRAIP